jgi:tRNA 2-selenouridine synthase
VYCWRGGQRSGALATVMARVGWPVARLDGGYQAYRRGVLADLATLPDRFTLRVICGTTGSGKSRLLSHLQDAGAQVLDLERLANHRGSVLGAVPQSPQPSQKLFESRIWSALRSFDRELPVFVESESRKVGNLRVPDALIGQMRAADCIVLDLPRTERVRLLREEYLHFEQTPQALHAQLDCLAALHGRTTIDEWKALADAGNWDRLVDRLLAEHYDPAYHRSIARNFSRIGTAHHVQALNPGSQAFQGIARALTGEHLEDRRT